MRSDPFPLKKFTDPAVNQAHQAAAEAIVSATDEQLARLKSNADAGRDEALARGPLLNAACTYLALAQADLTVGADPEKLYHFAANAFRDLGLLQKAAECYFNSALVGYASYVRERRGDSSFARRSAGRSKAMFSELGDDENSGDAHVLQQRIRSAEFRYTRKYPLALSFWLWNCVSKFGTSPSRWLGSTLVAILLFAVLYPLLISGGHFTPGTDIRRSGWALVTSSLGFSLGNLFQFGTLGTLTPASALGQLVAVAHGIVAFVLVGTGATFLTRR